MDWPTEAELREKNRELFARKDHWPPGALEACERVDAKYPGFYTNWHWASGPTYPRDGYYSHWLASGDSPVYGATIAELHDELQMHPRTEPRLTPITPLTDRDRP